VPSTSQNVRPSMRHMNFFNSLPFFEVNRRPGLEYCSMQFGAEDRAVGTLSGVIAEGTFTSGFSAPYGGFDFVREREDPIVVSEMVVALTNRLHERGVREIVVRGKPAAYSPNEPAVQASLLNAGYRVVSATLSFHLDICRFSTPEDYVGRLRSAARRHLLRGMSKDYRLAEARTDEDRQLAYSILVENREVLDRELTLSEDYVLAMQARFPDRVRSFLLLQDGTPSAAALTYRVAPQRELVVYWGDRPERRAASPMNLLAYCLFVRAHRTGIRHLDLGTVPLHIGADASGLARFKRSVLGEPSLVNVVSWQRL